MPNVLAMQMCENNKDIIIEYNRDQKMTKEEMQKILKTVLKDKVMFFDFKDNQKVVTGSYIKLNQEKIYFMLANITFMGGTEGQHPKDLKRIQYNKNWRDFCEVYSKKGKVVWMGLYSYKNMNVWAIFHPSTYINKHKGKDMVSKGGHTAQYSCHVYLNDLLKGHEDNVFEKNDKNGNFIVTVKRDYLATYFEGSSKNNPIIEEIKSMNANDFLWNDWIRADKAITYMKNLQNINGFNQWKQNLWNGWYTEAKYSEHLFYNPSKYIDYIATTKNASNLMLKSYGLDLVLCDDNNLFLGDLKAVCLGDENTLLNDEYRIETALKKFKKIWFIIYIHDKKSGSTNDFEMVKWRNNYIYNQGEWDKKKLFDELSAPRTPHSIMYKEMIVIELNDITKGLYFSIQKQFGKNSNNKERNNKYSISKKLLKKINDDSFVIYRYGYGKL